MPAVKKPVKSKAKAVSRTKAKTAAIKVVKPTARTKISTWLRANWTEKQHKARSFGSLETDDGRVCVIGFTLRGIGYTGKDGTIASFNRDKTKGAPVLLGHVPNCDPIWRFNDRDETTRSELLNCVASAWGDMTIGDLRKAIDKKRLKMATVA